MLDMESIPTIDTIDLASIPQGKYKYWLKLVLNGMGAPIKVPILVVKGKQPGPVFGLTAALHGNELNGISIIQKLFKEIDVQKLNGTVVGVPVMNVPSFHRKKRRFIDNTDLNHIMPGKPNGSVSEIYAWRLVDKIIKHLDYLVDLHTASNGRVNSLYVRADMSNKIVRQMALLQNPQLIVHNPPNDKTLRGVANEMNIPAITLEIGNPNLFQRGIVQDGLIGLRNLMSFLGLTKDALVKATEEIVICKSSYWLYTQVGGILTVYPWLLEKVEKGQNIATLKNIFGDILQEYYAPEDGVVIGRSVNPVNLAGGRILHLGIEE